MIKRLTASLMGAACALMVLAAPVAAQTTVGSNHGGNCYPFSCFASDSGAWYQQVYNAGAFSGPISFNTISFGRSQAGAIDGATYDISFYISPYDANSLTADRAGNEGTLLGSFGTFSLSGNMPLVLSLTGSTIHFDPAAGNLLLDVSVTGTAPLGGYNSFFNADNSTSVTARAYSNNEGGFAGTSGALVTTFSTVAGGVPEPASWALMIVGFGLVGGSLRQRRSAIA
jgi:hypothetical protein